MLENDACPFAGYTGAPFVKMLPEMISGNKDLR